MVACGHDLNDTDNHVIQLGINPLKRFIHGLITSDEQRNHLLRLVFYIAWGHLIRTKLLRKHPAIRYPEHLFYEDIYFGPLVGLYANGYVYIPEALYHFYNNPESTTRARNSPRIYDRPKAMKMAVDYFREHGLAQKYSQILNCFVSVVCYITVTDYLNRYDNPQFSYVKKIGEYARTCRINRDNPFLLKDYGTRLAITLTLLRYWPRMFWYLWKLKQRLKRS